MPVASHSSPATNRAEPGRGTGAAAVVLGGTLVLSVAIIAALVRPPSAGELPEPLLAPVVVWLVLSALVAAVAWRMRPREGRISRWWPGIAAVAGYTFFFALYPYLVSVPLWSELPAPIGVQVPLLLMLLGAVAVLILLARWLGAQVFEFMRRRSGL